jgi:hypothetical protein
MSRYDELRLRGNPVAAFKLDREEAATAAAALRIRVQRVREKRLTYPSDVEFLRALRRAQAGTEEIEETGGEE